VIQKKYLTVRRVNDGCFAKKEIDQVCTLLCGQQLEQRQNSSRPRPESGVAQRARPF
jgi:hypothetical protein